MGSVAKAIRFVFKAIILFFGLMLLLAVLWTLLQVAAAFSRREEADNALEARTRGIPRYRDYSGIGIARCAIARRTGNCTGSAIVHYKYTSTSYSVAAAGNAGANRPAEVVLGCQPGGRARAFWNSGSPSGRSNSARLQVK